MSLITIKVDLNNIDSVINSIEGQGVYSFKRKEKYLYIGKTMNFTNRLCAHRKWVKFLIETYQMDSIMIVNCDVDQMDELERDAIQYHKPYFNEQYKDLDYVEVKVKVPQFLAFKFKELALRSPEGNMSVFAVEGFEHVLNKYSKEIGIMS